MCTYIHTYIYIYIICKYITSYKLIVPLTCVSVTLIAISNAASSPDYSTIICGVHGEIETSFLSLSRLITSCPFAKKRQSCLCNGLACLATSSRCLVSCSPCTPHIITQAPQISVSPLVELVELVQWPALVQGSVRISIQEDQESPSLAGTVLYRYIRYLPICTMYIDIVRISIQEDPPSSRSLPRLYTEKK